MIWTFVNSSSKAINLANLKPDLVEFSTLDILRFELTECDHQVRVADGSQ